jgi:hypothetical protein
MNRSPIMSCISKFILGVVPVALLAALVIIGGCVTGTGGTRGTGGTGGTDVFF